MKAGLKIIEKCIKLQIISGFALLLSPFLHASTGNLVWGDDFNQAVGSTPSSANWTYDLGNNGWGNNELENYTSDAANCSVVSDPDATDGKALAITAIKTSSGGYTSARIKTEGLFSTTYGLIEARMKLPVGQGIWPAFWMLGNNINTVGWPQCGELDIMENIGSIPNKIYGTAHGPGYSGSNGIQGVYTLASGQFSSAYHTFAIQWAPNKIQWLCDGTVYQTLTPDNIPSGTTWVYNDSPFFLILNLAVGGGWPGNPDSTTQFPQTLYVDYVHVYNLTPAAPAQLGADANGLGTVDLSWTPCTYDGGSAITGYRIERANDSAFSQNLTSTDVGTATGYTDTAVTPGATYYYRVLTVTANAVSAPSPTASATPVTPGGASGSTVYFSVVSSRCFVGTGSNIGVAGIWVAGNKPITVLLRAAGPALGNLGPNSISNFLPDPMLLLYDTSGRLLATNAGWGTGASPAAVSSATTKVGAGMVFAQGSQDSAIVITLPPGGYSAQCVGASGDTGVALIEAYQVP